MSGWTYDTSCSGGASAGLFAAEGGALTLIDCDKITQTIRYAAVGVGVSTPGIKIPKIGKLELPKIGKLAVGGAYSVEAMKSSGAIYIFESFEGDELTREDITGLFMMVEISVGALDGIYGTVMLVGMDPFWLTMLPGVAILPPVGLFAETKIMRSAKGLIIMGGENRTYQFGAGGILLRGVLF